MHGLRPVGNSPWRPPPAGFLVSKEWRRGAVVVSLARRGRGRRRRRRKAHNKLLKSRRMKNQWHGVGTGQAGYIRARQGKLQGGSWWRRRGGGLVNGILLGHPFTRTRRKLEDLIWRAVWMPFAPAMPPIEPLPLYVGIYTLARGQGCTHACLLHTDPRCVTLTPRAVSLSFARSLSLFLPRRAHTAEKYL